MTLSDFLNALRSIRFLDADDLREAGVSQLGMTLFRVDRPIDAFLNLSDADLAKVWPLISAQVKREQSAEASR